MARLLISCLAMAIMTSGCANALSNDGFEVSTAEVTLAAGREAQVMAISDTAMPVVWTSDKPTVATVIATSDGEATITAVATGTATIAASMGPLARTIEVTVTAAELDRLEVASTRTVVPRGLSVQLAAIGHYSDRQTKDLTTEVTWSSSAAAIATVAADGLLTGTAVGAADIQAAAGEVRGMFSVSISDAALASLSIAGVSGPLAKGLDVQLVVTGVFSDSSTDDITDLVAWSTTNEAIASVSHGGLVHAMAASGAATITATADQLEATTTITVAPAIVTSIALGPALDLALGVDQLLVATGTYSDETSANVTALATWSIASGTAVTVTPAGLVRASAQGSATVRAAIGAAIGTVDATVGPAVAERLELSTGDLALMQQQRLQLRASLVFTDDTRQDVTTTAVWSASAASVTVASGRLDATSTTGSATIAATASGQESSLVATVGSVTCHPVINEVQAGGANAAAGDEWVELYNPCSTTFAVTGWTIVYRAATTTGTTDTSTLQTLAGSLAPGDLRLYAGTAYSGSATPDATLTGTGLQSTNAAIGLRSGPKDTGPLVDAVAYGAVTTGHPFIETTNASALANGKSVARAPFDGHDTNNNAANFALDATPTPRALNAP